MEVEVVFPQVCGAFYKAAILDLQIEEQKVLLSFEDSWKPDTWADLDHVRFLPLTPADNSIQPGSTVEALLPHQDNEPPGWWNGTLLKSKGELHVVEFQSGNEKYQDIVEKDKIRPPNTNEPLSKYKFHRREFPVPDDIQTYCVKQSVHENFRKRIEAVCVQYDKDKKSLVVLAGHEGSLKRATLLIDIHLRDLRTQKQVMGRADMAAQREQQQQQRQLDSGVFEQQVYVASDLVGLAIGRDGNNVNEVRKLDGIMSVEFEDHNQMFRVRAKTPDALSQAKELLEIVRDTVMIPRNLAGRVIGKRGHVIQQILEKSGVHNIKVMGDDESAEKKDESSDVPFDFIGRKSAVEDAMLMLNYHLDHLKSLESILQSRREFEVEEPPIPTHFPAPVPYRGYRGGGRMRERGGEEGQRWGGGGGWGEGGDGDEGGWGEREESGARRGRGRGSGGQWQRRGGWDRGRRGDQRERPPVEAESPDNHPSNSHETQEVVEYYHSSDESDTAEEEQDQRNDQGNSEEENSPPETDEQGPDRRRAQGPSRPQRGGRGGGYGRGRGGWRRGGRGGRGGRGRGGGYRNSRPQQQQQRDDGGATGTTNWETEDSKQEEKTSGGGSAPKPQRTGGRGRRQNAANVTANTAPTENTSAPDTTEP